VTALAAVGLPKAAYYAPRQRYRAEKLLEFLRDSCRATFTKIVGITEVDISTTKGEYYDWGIFGLATIGGAACVVSSFRLKGKASAERFLTRLLGTVTHELGHTFGLLHCPTKGCVMEDAKGTVKTVDASTGKFCAGCRKLLEIALSTY
jgi:archaemetzincin